MEKSPAISLLITTKNRRTDLLRTLAVMVPRLLPDNEIIVFDDGSTDGTAEAVAQSFPEVSLKRHSIGLGYIAARNWLLDQARGSYSISLDDDSEIVSPDFISIIVEYFAKHPRAAVIASSIYWGPSLPEEIRTNQEEPRKVKSFVGCGHIWRMEAWRLIPHYPEWFEFYGEEDFAAYQLLKGDWEIHHVPQILVHHRVDLKKRPANVRGLRYRQQLRAGIYNMLLFYPMNELVRVLPYVLWVQIKLRLFRDRKLEVIPDLFWVTRKLIQNYSQIRLSRSPLSKTEWSTWNNTYPAVIYWAPGKNIDRIN